MDRHGSGAEDEVRALARRAPVPALVGAVKFGTAGWTDPSLLACKRFYPSGCSSPSLRLSHYAHHFGLVEVDATYYALPSQETAQLWVDRTPDGFVFDVKAHPVLTGHPIDRNRLPKDIAAALRDLHPDRARLYPDMLPQDARAELVQRFGDVIAPIAKASKLGCVMVQLPPWTTATRGAVRKLERLPGLLEGVQLAIEFRHPSWLDVSRRDRVMAMLRANGMSYVVVDEPRVRGGGVPAWTVSTNDRLSVVRFHGQNVAGWHAGATVAQRFNYLYSVAEMRQWTDPVRWLSHQSEQVHAVFNNCVRDFAVINAKALAALLNADDPAGG